MGKIEEKIVKIQLDSGEVRLIRTFFEDTTDYEKLFKQAPIMTAMFSEDPNHGFKITFNAPDTNI